MNKNIATAAVILDGNRVLLTRRKTGQKLAGYWEFPGGKQEKGESLQACLEREIKEELTLNIVAGEVVATSDYSYEHGTFTLIALEATILSGMIQLSVHDKFEWIPVTELLSFRLAPADIPIAKFLQQTII